MDEKNVEFHIKELERARMQFVPEKYIGKLLASAEDIVNEKKMLLSAPMTAETMDYLMKLIINDINENRKFKKTECLRLFARLLIQNKHALSLNKEQLSRLFLLYQYTMSLGNEGLKQAFTEAIKGERFDHEAIAWLIQHAAESEHYVELLLNDAAPSHQIIVWAKQAWASGELPHKAAQIAAILLLAEELPDGFNPDELETDTLMQAISCSKLPKRRKRELIIEHMDFSNYASALDAASRLGIGKVSKLLLKHYEGLLADAAVHNETDEPDSEETLEYDEV